MKPFDDVRLRGFSHRTSVSDAWDWIDSHCQLLDEQLVPLSRASRRVLACDITSHVDVPAFRRAMMDGYAVRAADTRGATPSNRVTLRLIGHVFPGHPFAGDVAPGEALRIMTGAAVPATADAVLPVEQTELVGDQVCVLGDVPPTKNVGDIGEDVSRGTVVLSRNRCLRPQDLGLLSSIGIAGVPVVRQPRVRLIITGNELLPPGATGGAFQTVDANSPMLRAFVERDGGIVVDRAFLTADDPAAILAAMEDSEADFVLVSGGSSVGAEDHAPRVLATHGELAIHGIAIRPGSPAGMGRLNNRLVFLLPGNPVSCLAAYDFFAGRAIRGSAGRDRDWTYSRRQLELQHKIASQLGRVDYVRVRVTSQGVEPLSIAGASTLSSTTRADGFVIVPAESEGLPEGSSVDVFLYD